MSRFIDLSGKTFNKLTAMHVEGKDKQGRYKWRCSCVCGNEVICSSRSLVSGNTQSCGCLSIRGNLVHGVGIYRPGKYKTSHNGKPTKEKQLWVSMLARCYSHKHHQRYPTYQRCEVSENFKDFQYFAEWCNNQKGFGISGFQLDKDILGNGLLYSETTCCFVPAKLNAYFKCSTFKKFYKVGTGKYTSNCSGTHLGTFCSEEAAILAYDDYRLGVILNIVQDNINDLDQKVIEFLRILCNQK